MMHRQRSWLFFLKRISCSSRISRPRACRKQDLEWVERKLIEMLNVGGIKDLAAVCLGQKEPDLVVRGADHMHVYTREVLKGYSVATQDLLDCSQEALLQFGTVSEQPGSTEGIYMNYPKCHAENSVGYGGSPLVRTLRLA
jgi:hypothetical protein